MDSINGKRRHPALRFGLPKAKVGGIPKVSLPWGTRGINGMVGTKEIALLLYLAKTARLVQ